MQLQDGMWGIEQSSSIKAILHIIFYLRNTENMALRLSGTAVAPKLLQTIGSLFFQCHDSLVQGEHIQHQASQLQTANDGCF